VDQTPGLLREASHLLLEKVIVLASCSMIEVLSDFHPTRAGNKDVVGTNQLHSHKKHDHSHSQPRDEVGVSGML